MTPTAEETGKTSTMRHFYDLSITSSSLLTSSDANNGNLHQAKMGRTVLGDNIHHSYDNMSATKQPTYGGPLRHCRRFIGQVAKPSDVAADFPIDLRCLRKGDPVWVKRTDRSWTYALVKKRENGQNASVVVMVSSEGATKAFSTKRCPMFLRKVMDDDASENGVDM